MKPVKTRAGLLSAAARDPHGDHNIIMANDQEVGLLKRMGGAGVRNPKTGLLQFYEDAGGEGGHGGPVGQGGHNDLGHNGGGGGNGGGNMSGHTNYSGGTTPSGSWGGYGGGISINRVGQNLTANQVNNNTPVVGKNEVVGYYGDKPTGFQNAMHTIAGLFGGTYNPNAINYNGHAYSSYGFDPLGAALTAASFATPLATPLSLGYKVAKWAGMPTPEVAWNGVPASEMTHPNTSTAANVAGAGSNSNPVGNALAQNQNDQQAALAASTGQAGSIGGTPAGLGLLGLQQGPQSGQVAPGYGYSLPGYGYLAWGR